MIKILPVILLSSAQLPIMLIIMSATTAIISQFI